MGHCGKQFSVDLITHRDRAHCRTADYTEAVFPGKNRIRGEILRRPHRRHKREISSCGVSGDCDPLRVDSELFGIFREVAQTVGTVGDDRLHVDAVLHYPVVYARYREAFLPQLFGRNARKADHPLPVAGVPAAAGYQVVYGSSVEYLFRWRKEGHAEFFVTDLLVYKRFCHFCPLRYGKPVFIGENFRSAVRDNTSVERNIASVKAVSVGIHAGGYGSICREHIFKRTAGADYHYEVDGTAGHVYITSCQPVGGKCRFTVTEPPFIVSVPHEHRSIVRQGILCAVIDR